MDDSISFRKPKRSCYNLVKITTNIFIYYKYSSNKDQFEKKKEIDSIMVKIRMKKEIIKHTIMELMLSKLERRYNSNVGIKQIFQKIQNSEEPILG